jgi:RNA recognition motif-containing protein
VRGGWNNKSKGYGFVSFIDPFDCAKALREMNGKYLGNRPMKIRKSTWKDNDINEVKKKEKKKRKIAESLGLA